MKNEDVELALMAISESIADLAQGQSAIMEILSKHVTGLSDETRKKLLISAKGRLVLADKLIIAANRIQEPNKAPEPTPTSVTPPANSR